MGGTTLPSADSVVMTMRTSAAAAERREPEAATASERSASAAAAATGAVAVVDAGDRVCDASSPVGYMTDQSQATKGGHCSSRRSVKSLVISTRDLLLLTSSSTYSTKFSSTMDSWAWGHTHKLRCQHARVREATHTTREEEKGESGARTTRGRQPRRHLPHATWP